MCKVYITHEQELSHLEREAIQAKFRKDPKKKHKVTFCRENRSMVIAARFDTPMMATEKAITFMRSLYDPIMVEVVSMPRMVA